ncbi:hypothetical protein ACIRPK_36310 [Kitasatospora sp. NPDC101801]|uniref:hypothetical protein n=1 Tax=Kitasatospora sp. NPDC101801 TaxID=3364103 RepID=UPI00381A26DD
MRTSARVLAAGLVAALALGAGVSGVFAAGGESAASAPSIVEDGAYPNAGQFLTQYGITLKSGDGNITLAPCDGNPDLLTIFSRSREDICFRTTGDKGYLSLEIPRITGARGNSYNVTVATTSAGASASFKVLKNTWTPAGSTTDPEGRDYTLMEITATK